jgi:hypothetical protein
VATVAELGALVGRNISMATEYYPCVFRLEGVDHYVIWYSDDRDGLVREGGRLVTFSSLARLHAYARSRGLTVQPAEVAIYDWDSVARWCDKPVMTGIAVSRVLNAWNMVLDAMPPGNEPGLFSHANARANDLYDKLFRANNLPAVTPPDAEYYPIWTRAELVALAQLLRLGVAEIRHQLNGREAV